MMKRKFFQVFAAALTLISAGCSNDDLSGNLSGENESGKDAVYMNVTVKLPVGAGGRSETLPGGGSSSGTEVGLDHENTVNSVMLVLAKTDNTFIGCAEKQESLTAGADGTTVTAVQSISKSVLGAYYGPEGKLDDTEIRVFVFCNPTNALRIILEGTQKGSDTWYDQICTINESPTGTCDNAAIWGGAEHKQGFLMSSYEISTKNLPANFSDWDKFTSKDTPFNLSGKNTMASGSDSDINNDGAIKVERSVARFDFKDGSGSDNTYNVIYDKDDDKKCLVQIQLQRMALVNMSKNFFYLRRVSDDGLKTGNNYKLGGVETAANYVVDTDADDKNGGTLPNNEYANHFNFCLGHSDGDIWTIDPTAREQWYSSKITDVLSGTEDNKNDEDWTPIAPSTKDGYRIWRYVTENTIPDPTSNQNNALSTGIVFKGKMIATTDAAGVSKTLYDALSNSAEVKPTDPILYAYGSDIYVRWTEVRAMAIKLGPASPMYKAVFGTACTVTPVAEEKEGETIKVTAVYSDDKTSADFLWNVWFNEKNAVEGADQKAFKLAATTANFTLYERSNDGNLSDGNYGPGYYCYYYYWNRHNDNGKPAIMGPMEFAVVRNNVYKLAVTSISRLGHPRISENDPDPKEPDDPDEEGDVYLSVSVEVLPWVVRVNNIDF